MRLLAKLFRNTQAPDPRRWVRVGVQVLRNVYSADEAGGTAVFLSITLIPFSYVVVVVIAVLTLF